MNVEMGKPEPKSPKASTPADTAGQPKTGEAEVPIPPEVGQTVEGFFKTVIERPKLKDLLKKLADH